MHLIIETYRGYNIASKSITKWVKNKISGHWYATQKPLVSFCISGPGARTSDWYFSLNNCKKHIDFLIKYKHCYAN